MRRHILVLVMVGAAITGYMYSDQGRSSDLYLPEDDNKLSTFYLV